MNQNLAGKVAVVTGGGQGLGKAICEALAERNVHVIVCDIKKEQAQAVAAAINDSGGNAAAFFLDVRDEQAVAKTVETIRKSYAHIDFLINNAGTDVTKSVAELSIEEWDRVIGVNLRGPFLLSKTLLPDLVSSHGQIVNIASTAAKRTWTEAAAYHASKWGLLGFSHALHAEARRVGVKVTAVISGGMRTGFIMDRFPDTDPAVLQDPKNVADTVCYVLTLPPESVIPEVMVLPMKETSWP